jgi:acylphosphatase
MKSYKFIVNGRVQGVYYRQSIKDSAIASNFNGYVKNLPNGTVEAVVTCDDNRLKKFISILEEGSISSIVEDIQQHDSNEIFKDGFEVKH